MGRSIETMSNIPTKKVQGLRRVESAAQKMEIRATEQQCTWLLQSLYAQIDVNHDCKLTRVEMDEMFKTWDAHNANTFLMSFWPEGMVEMSPKAWLEAWTKFEQSPVCAGDVAVYQSFVFWLQVVVNERITQSAQAQADMKAFVAGFAKDPTWGVEVKQLQDSIQSSPEMSTLALLAPVGKSDPDATLTEETAPNAYAKVKSLWELLDDFGDNADDSLSSAEVNLLRGPAFKGMFTELDGDDDKMISGAEWIAFWEKRLKSLGKAVFIRDLGLSINRVKKIKDAFNNGMDTETAEAFKEAKCDIAQEAAQDSTNQMMMGAGIIAAVAVTVGMVMWFTRKK